MVEAILYAPTAYYHCMHCEVAFREIGVSNHAHDEQVFSSLPTDMAEDYQLFSDWVRDIFKRYCDRVVVRVIDAASIEGIVKSLRYGSRRFPVIVIGGQTVLNGGAFDAADQEIARRLDELLPVNG
jgi:glutaredoxin